MARSVWTQFVLDWISVMRNAAEPCASAHGIPIVSWILLCVNIVTLMIYY